MGRENSGGRWAIGGAGTGPQFSVCIRHHPAVFVVWTTRVSVNEPIRSARCPDRPANSKIAGGINPGVEDRRGGGCLRDRWESRDENIFFGRATGRDSVRAGSFPMIAGRVIRVGLPFSRRVGQRGKKGEGRCRRIRLRNARRAVDLFDFAMHALARKAGWLRGTDTVMHHRKPQPPLGFLAAVLPGGVGAGERNRVRARLRAKTWSRARQGGGRCGSRI